MFIVASPKQAGERQEHKAMSDSGVCLLFRVEIWSVFSKIGSSQGGW